MTIPQDTRKDELRNLAAKIQDAVENYAQGKAKNSSDIIKLCQDLQYRSESPEVFAERLRYQPLDICALMIAVEGGILQALSSRGDDTTADQLAELTNRPRLHIVRVLRLLTAIGVCDEIGFQLYRANDKTPVVASKGQIGGFRVCSIPACAITTNIAEYFSKYPNETTAEGSPKSAYSYTYGKDMYDYLRENKDRKADFDAYMEARKKDKQRRWHHVYPVMSELASNGDVSATTIVDVGGSRGHDLESFLESNPEFNGSLILQDLPETVEPIMGEKRVFKAMAHDFFRPQPIKGARLYLLLAVLHNWEDAECGIILRNLAEAMKPGYSRLLVSGMLVPEVDAGRLTAELDMQMWLLQHSRQRTKREIEELMGAAGLEIMKIWENGDRESIIEVQAREK
ncbi:Demethylsterigmatocystin 6-O-methyltransferase [Talaromyces pinophilus]|nr:Demethylsterigmatocystin 6-O-methyltransferase [Talaromyces pinophilus]